LVGFIHAEDIVRLVLDGVDLGGLDLADVMHPPVVVPPTKKVDEMFDFFQENNARAAAVLNEFGGVEGFITMKDVLSFIFGQISGEVRGQELYQERDDNVYEVPGEMKLNDFNNLTNFGIDDPRMTTVGGVVFRHLDRLPHVGDRVTVEGVEITVLEMDAHRIARVRVSSGGTTAEPEELVSPTATESLVEEPSGVGDDAKHREATPEDVETVDDGTELEEQSDISEPNRAVGTDTRHVALVKRSPGP
jgi:CBS domain containing-hemolysin-like protein